MDTSIIRKSLIGRAVEIRQARNPSLTGIAGTIIDESRGMLTINGEKRWRISKTQAIFTFPAEGVAIDGKIIVGTADERLKRS